MSLRKALEEARKALEEQRKLSFHHQQAQASIRSPFHGKHRRTPPQAHDNSAQQSGTGDDGADAFATAIYTSIPASAWRTFNAGVGAGGALAARQAQSSFDKAILDQLAQVLLYSQNQYLIGDTPSSIPYAGIQTGEIIGHRWWYAMSDGLLRSVAHYFRWVPGQVITGDINEVVDWTPTPIFGGVYAFKDPEMDEASRDMFYDWRMYYAPHSPIIGIAIGTIEMWGDVVEHERGYRASHAKIRTIDKVLGYVDIDKLRERYGV